MPNNHKNLPLALIAPTWGEIKEVTVDTIHPKARRGKWEPLGAEILLRLEKTPLPYALEIPFPDEKMANAARDALRRYVNHCQGMGTVFFSQKGPLLYVYRGHEWK